jgi:hypothetical protein
MAAFSSDSLQLPGLQLDDVSDRVILQTDEDGCEPRSRVCGVGLGGLDPRIDCGGAPTAGIRASVDLCCVGRRRYRATPARRRCCWCEGAHRRRSGPGHPDSCHHRRSSWRPGWRMTAWYIAGAARSSARACGRLQCRRAPPRLPGNEPLTPAQPSLPSPDHWFRLAERRDRSPDSDFPVREYLVFQVTSHACALPTCNGFGLKRYYLSKPISLTS